MNELSSPVIVTLEEDEIHFLLMLMQNYIDTTKIMYDNMDIKTKREKALEYKARIDQCLRITYKISNSIDTIIEND